MSGCFITGTDTGAGKTWVTLGLMSCYRDQGLRVAGMKPVSSGGGLSTDGVRNEDALQILEQAGTHPPYHLVNPYAFEPPIAPSLAAGQAGVTMQLEVIVRSYLELSAQADVVVVEGIGGWRMPLSDDLQMADVVQALKLSVILVVGLRLGCLNHALLSVEAIERDGATLQGWIASPVDPGYPNADATIEVLSRTLAAPLLARVPRLPRLDATAIGRSLGGVGLPHPGASAQPRA